MFRPTDKTMRPVHLAQEREQKGKKPILLSYIFFSYIFFSYTGKENVEKEDNSVAERFETEQGMRRRLI